MSDFPVRNCPVCKNHNNQFLFKQEFANYSDGGLMDEYDVVICSSCGAGYASGIPSQFEFDRYYETMSKYEHGYRSGEVSDVDKARFSQVVDLVERYLKKDDRIVDIGCATGALLAEFQKRGFNNIKGYDPSKECSEAALRLYGIKVAISSISSLSEVSESADLVIMTGVLEHLADVDQSILIIKKLLAKKGMIYFEVPDATRYDEWFSAPFQFFSMEHVNFFSPLSLSNLLYRHGYEVVFSQRVTRYLSSNSVEPAIAGLYRYECDHRELTKDDESKYRLEKYITKSYLLDQKIKSIISVLVENQVPLVIWGAGTHTLRLMRTSELSKANIVGILDSNSRYHDKKLMGFPITSPNNYNNSEVTILISSQVAENEIKQYIIEKLRWKNNIICFYEGASLDSL